MIVPKIKPLSYTKLRNTNNPNLSSSTTATHADDSGGEMKPEDIIKAKTNFAYEMKRSSYKMSRDACSMKGLSSATQVYRLCGKLTENALGTSEASMQRLDMMKERVATNGRPGSCRSVTDAAKRIELYSANRKELSQEQKSARNNVLERCSHSHLTLKNFKQANFDKLLCFPMDRGDPTLRSSDIVYEAADKKSVLLLREYVSRSQDSDNISTTPTNNYEAKETATLASEDEYGRKQTLADASLETVVDQSESPVTEKESAADSLNLPEGYENTEMAHYQIPFYGQQLPYKDATRSTRTAEQHIAPIPSTPQHVIVQQHILSSSNISITVR
uniref:Uncharacterized protein n=1 Tax=Parascaris univalens TaxID=6257 RepID=A0A914ZGL3_PARUN